MTTKVLILNSGRCCWGQCLFCGWGKQAASVNVRKLKNKVNHNLKPGLDTLKIFSSGSFFDDQQFPPEFRKWFAEKCEEVGVGEVILESRPEFITEPNLDQFKNVNLTVAMGLEVADDEVLEKLNKGFELADFEIAAQLLKNRDCGVRAYLLVNPPLVNDVQCVLDKSVEYALDWADSIVLINTFPHAESQLFDLWLRGDWQPLNQEEFNEVVEEWKENAKIETDFTNWAFVPKFPEDKREELKGVGEEFLTHRHYELWQNYLTRIYTPPEDKDILLFLPCSYRKPYSQSKLHRRIKKTLRKAGGERIHEVMISSPGVIPREFENKYPFAHYDWPEWEETPEIKQRYIQVTKRRIEEFLRKHYGHYKKLFYYLRPDSESSEALRLACSELGIKPISCVDKEKFNKLKEAFPKNPLSERAFRIDLKKTISDNLS